MRDKDGCDDKKKKVYDTSDESDEKQRRKEGEKYEENK